jgi:hypothetical protein
MPAVLAETMGLPGPIRAIAIDDPEPPPTVGLIYPQREPITPLTAALVLEARRIGAGWMADLRRREAVEKLTSL